MKFSGLPSTFCCHGNFQYLIFLGLPILILQPFHSSGLPPFQFTQKKHNQWFENEKIEDLIVSTKYHEIWLPNEAKFSGLPLVVGENFWFTLRKSVVIQKY